MEGHDTYGQASTMHEHCFLDPSQLHLFSLESTLSKQEQIYKKQKPGVQSVMKGIKNTTLHDTCQKHKPCFNSRVNKYSNLGLSSKLNVKYTKQRKPFEKLAIIYFHYFQISSGPCSLHLQP